MPGWSTLKKLIWLYRANGAGGGGGTETTITGVSPLLLAAALKKPIKSLTQYGLCSQADTPTPSAPVPIMCNNGALTMVDDELPIGYKRLTGISFGGNVWYETGEALTGNDEVTMTLDNTASQGQNVFGSYNGTSSGSKNFSLFIYGNGSTTSSYFRYGEQLLRPRYGTGERTITFGKSGTDGFAADASVTPDTFATPANAYIGMLPNSTSPSYTGDIKGNIIVGTRLKWIPCERVSDNAIGYYEAVKGVFIAPSGTGTPTALGYDGSHYRLAVVGTDEVISISPSGSTASAPDLFAVGDYADEVEIISGGVTRKVGIKVFDGTETWEYSASGYTFDWYDSSIARSSEVGSQFLYCSHFRGANPAPAAQNRNGYAVLYNTSTPSNRVGIGYNAADKDVTAWKAFLAEQYAQGTPVIVLYPLKEETTESVTPQPLNTAAGDNGVSVTANVSPIQLEATYIKETA